MQSIQPETWLGQAAAPTTPAPDAEILNGAAPNMTTGDEAPLDIGPTSNEGSEQCDREHPQGTEDIDSDTARPEPVQAEHEDDMDADHEAMRFGDNNSEGDGGADKERGLNAGSLPLIGGMAVAMDDGGAAAGPAGTVGEIAPAAGTGAMMDETAPEEGMVIPEGEVPMGNALVTLAGGVPPGEGDAPNPGGVVRRSKRAVKSTIDRRKR